jgi:hypothetical protein
MVALLITLLVLAIVCVNTMLDVVGTAVPKYLEKYSQPTDVFTLALEDMNIALRIMNQ